MKIFVYGATGIVGTGVVQGLVKAGHTVWGGSRKPLPDQKSAGWEWVETDALHPDKGIGVLEKVEAAFFLSPPGYTNQKQILGPWIEKAKQSGLKKVVLMTAMGVEFAPKEVPMRALEIQLEESGLDWNIIRPNWFLQNFQTFWISGILKDQKIYFPGGNAKVSFIDARDISEVACALLTKNPLPKQALGLTGGQAVDHDFVASQISKVSGKDIRYVDISSEDFKKGLIQAGLPEDYASFLVMIAESLKAGNSSPIVDTVQKVLGKPPRTVEQYAIDFQAAWK